MKKRSVKQARCVICGGNLSFTRSKFQGFPIDAYKCEKCHEEYFDPQQAENILEVNKSMSRVYNITIGKIQSNLIIRIPVKVSESLNLRKGEIVNLEVENLNELCIKIPERSSSRKVLVLNEK
ncbi:MAG: AbrB/MazE/SpoVT family DNA-binding domain-containing protein [Candidatus Aenigmatarchaeota archaeon]